jgi:ribosomal protein L25 (general stress protein Ctc)
MLKDATLIEMPRHRFKNFDEARKWAKENIVGMYKNENTGEDISISRRAVDKYLSKKAVKKSISIDAHLSTLKVLPELIKTSILKETHPDKGEDVNIKEIQRLYGVVSYGEKKHPVKITVKIIKGEGNKAYSYEVMGIEKTRMSN